MAAYRATQRRAAAGVDGVTWEMYGQNLEENVRDLSARLKRGAYRAKPVRRVYIDKADGSRRPLGVPTVEDKVVQRATSEVLGAVYEQDFLGFSYGFRPGRSPHDALDALSTAITKKEVNWVLDADIRGFYDALDHEWLVKFVEHRIFDRRVIRLIHKWLKTARKRLRAQLKEVKEALRRRWNSSVPRLGAYLRAVVRGHTQYFGVPFNSRAIINFRFQVGVIWPSLEQGA